MNRIDYALIYHNKYNEVYTKGKEHIDKAVKNRGKFTKKNILYRLIPKNEYQYRSLRYLITSEESTNFHKDAYIEALVSAFQSKHHDYGQDEINMFVSHKLKELKREYKNPKEPLKKPEAYQYLPKKTIQFLAELAAYEKLQGYIGELLDKETGYNSELINYDEEEPEAKNHTKKRKKEITIPLTGIVRTQHDKITSLSQEETLLLANYFRQANVFLSIDLVTNVTLAKTIEVLTGYSAESARQKFSSLGKMTKHSKKERLNKIQTILHKINALITNDLKS